MPLLSLLLLLLLQVIATPVILAEAQSECTVRNVLGQAVYDLRSFKLNNSSSYTVDGLDTGFTFKLNVCGPLPGLDSEGIAAQWQQGGRVGSLGQTSTKLRLRGENLILEYVGGEECPNAPQKRQSALLTFICDKSVGGYGYPEFISEWDQCAFMFLWRTPAACPSSTNTTDNSNDAADNDAADTVDDDGARGASRGAVVFIVLFVLGSVYMLGGFLYNRVLNLSSHLRGIEQLPNYRFWYGTYLFGKKTLVGTANGLSSIIDRINGQRRGLIRIDSAEFNMRNEIFHSVSDYHNEDEEYGGYNEERALPRTS
ncbi:Cation-independent mannose-6-phosphate receptor CI-MPR [Coemansia spiralis]|uniref:Autophagy-related protein 27 n=1 Tax=Coemansia spiralis TaxID=417178 RepID=A0A9W8KZ12_9FUNG|nr:mannose-6-phosphate receptor binding domain-containing protein [Coemansia spiralis]KAJ2624742.1 Cation-independent mannose-6-phosphate receptor CI-MPR [Coemansia sp. RSA 1358]KAJ2678285.1 Cation-independent mannose-6-phosphate receptor CI-MPR [Coemansia spiralis]